MSRQKNPATEGLNLIGHRDAEGGMSGEAKKNFLVEELKKEGRWSAGDPAQITGDST